MRPLPPVSPERPADGPRRARPFRSRLARAWNRSFLAPLLPRIDLDAELRAQKVAAVYDRLLAAMLCNLGFALVFLAFLPVRGSGRIRAIWLLAVALLTLFRWLDIRAYQGRRGQAGAWVPRILAGGAVQGALWAFAAGALLPGTVEGRLIGLLILVSISAAVVIFQSPIWSSYCLYVTIMVVPALAALVRAPDPGLATLGALGFIYLLVMAFASGNASRRLEDSLVSARANAELYEQRRLEEGLRQSQKLESLVVLAGGIAHDFNNLLGAILGNLNLLQVQNPPGTPGAALLANMETAVNRAGDLTRQMLAFSGGGTFVVQDLDLDQVIRDAEPLLRRGVARQASLTLDLGSAGGRVSGDLGQLHQLLVSLVTNASEALGGQPGEVRVRTRRQDPGPAQAAGAGAILPPVAGDQVLLEVEDSGEGMDPEMAARIFDPFFSTRGTGRGLGLSAALGILRSHRAGITVRSLPGAGSTFRICFPVSVRPASRERPAGPPVPRSARGRVLLVDDEPTLLATAEAMLESLGLEVETAADGIEALERFKAAGGFSLVILDLTMPRMDGHQAFRELRSLSPELPVILSSGHSAQSAAELLQGPGGPSAFLHKPYSFRELREIVEATLASSSG